MRYHSTIIMSKGILIRYWNIFLTIGEGPSPQQHDPNLTVTVGQSPSKDILGDSQEDSSVNS